MPIRHKLTDTPRFGVQLPVTDMQPSLQIQIVDDRLVLVCLDMVSPLTLELKMVRLRRIRVMVRALARVRARGRARGRARVQTPLSRSVSAHTCFPFATAHIILGRARVRGSLPHWYCTASI